MRERPISFKPEMVRAILSGSKTQTRRVIRPEWIKRWLVDLELDGGRAEAVARCPYGKPGDRLWVRETWQQLDSHLPDETEPAPVPHEGNGTLVYRGDGDGWIDSWNENFRWRPSIYMPRWASRLTLQLTEVRVQRLQEIMEWEAQAEGVPPSGCFGGEVVYRDSFRHLWDRINEERAPWASNPWVFALSFDVKEARNG